LLVFEYVKELYDNDYDFAEIYNAYGHWFWVSFIWWMVTCLKRIDCMFLLVLCMNYLFAAHEGGLMGHFEVVKTLYVLHE
jgi:hypothetical protein